MSDTIILKIENISKQYRLGVVGTGTISHDLNKFFAKIRGKEDPFLKIGELNDRSKKGNSEYVWALKNINFEVKRGEILGIIGKNGAGKSTLLKILSKVTGPSTGTIKAKGRIASLLEVGTGFHPEMTGRENIFLNGAILGMNKKEISKKLEEIIEFSGCERYIDTPVKRYSSGMKVRLAFAVAAHLEPDILVIDEVLAVGDAEFQKKAIGKIQDISQGQGRTVLFVSHDMAAIQNLCTKVIVLTNGELTFNGEVTEGVSKYLELNSNSNNRNLLSSNSRKGKGTSKFKSVTFSSVFNNHTLTDTDIVYSGAKVFVDIVIKNYIKVKRSIRMTLEILDSNNIPVASVGNEFTRNRLFLEGDFTKIRFEIEELNLIAKDYKMSLWGADDLGCFDYIEDEVSFTVIETDFFKTGIVPRNKQHGHFLLRNKCYNA
jgi:lipopolysaccharide transport system ATP-binding protein